jgi:putative mRNA 3-end processing factor
MGSPGLRPLAYLRQPKRLLKRSAKAGRRKALEVIVLGAARQVGRSGFLVKSGDKCILLDYGAMPLREPAFPLSVSTKDLSAVLLTHAHLDHTGAAPLLYVRRGQVPVYATPLTFELTDLLVRDFLKISGFYLPYEFLDLNTMLQNTKEVSYGEKIRIDGFEATFNEAGHIPGSATILLCREKRILYTGDINTTPTRLLNPCVADWGDVDLVIIEATYGTSEHPPRAEVERRLVQFAEEIVEGGGVLLIPAFSVARAQEIAMVLRQNNFKHHIAMDGMALQVNQILGRYPGFLRDAQALERTLSSVEMITSWSQRRRVVQRPSVIISPAGMLAGGAAVFYNEEVALSEKNGVALVSFQAPGTPGRTLMEKGLLLYRGRPTKLRARLERFNLSSHADSRGLLEVLKKVRGEPRVLTVHAEEEVAVGFAEKIKESLGLEASAPYAGERITV